MGQKGRCCHRWWLRGFRPAGPVDRHYTFAYIFAAVEPATGRNFCLVIPADSTAVMAMDGPGWHTSNALKVPPSVTLLRLPPYAPELNPVEPIRLYLCERHLSHRLHACYTAILDAICAAWRKLTPKRVRSLCNYPWISQVRI